MPKHTSKRGYAKRSRSSRTNKKMRRTRRKMKGGFLGIPSLGISKQRRLTNKDFENSFIARRIKFGFTVYTLYFNKQANNAIFDFTTGFMNRIKYNANKDQVWRGIIALLFPNPQKIDPSPKQKKLTDGENKDLVPVQHPDSELYIVGRKTDAATDIIEAYSKNLRSTEYLTYDNATKIVIKKPVTDELKTYLGDFGTGLGGREVDKLYVVDNVDTDSNFTEVQKKYISGLSTKLGIQL